jgi:three-Cys-motif partner protein
MVTSRYSWERGVELEEHTRRKHKILREYLARYLTVRCGFPQQSKFRLAIVEGFAGGGRYKGGEPGSPLIFVEELRAAAERFNLKRKDEGMSPLDIEAFLILNDAEPGTTAILKNNLEPLLRAIRADVPRLHLQTAYFEEPFETLYPEIRVILGQRRYQNVLFNLDQYGYSDVRLSTLANIAAAFSSAEIFYTFGILSLLAFLAKRDSALLRKQLGFLGVTDADLSPLESQLSRIEWLGAAERIVFECFGSCAQYVSTFFNPQSRGLAVLVDPPRQQLSGTSGIQQRIAPE